ncbi:hypothetical protein IPJ72_04450 [Candidatus Peregrinibacteria bacterium]|nr:MAG: hypothetical protein IPJ72_04450 [Candidatus Peregrinibacteria bacterium]
MKKGIRDHHGAHMEAILNSVTQTVEAQNDEPVLSCIQKVRAGIKDAGISIAELAVMKQTDVHQGGEKVALASFNPANDQIAMAPEIIDQMREVSDARDRVRRVVMHERRHRESHRAEGSRRVDQWLAHLFGKEAIHAVEESMASLKTTENFDAYNSERSEARRMAAMLKMPYSELMRIKQEGDWQRLQMAAINAGLISIAA